MRLAVARRIDSAANTAPLERLQWTTCQKASAASREKACSLRCRFNFEKMWRSVDTATKGFPSSWPTKSKRGFLLLFSFLPPLISVGCYGSPRKGN
ncbi:hypothetical protein EYF80_024010 [Liparis tanakae]|uniref:Uncharacterized protein n=1 Tax=Liparis tanakae TaxID=230148 RepID=A0A4Z2HIW4_9TELE|nr:hypothetical protein EYF80_024010 [Liparis tanakae]